MSPKLLNFLREHFPSFKPDYDPFPAYRQRIALDHVRRGDSLFESKEYALALDAYNEAIEFEAVAEAFCNRSCVFVQTADYDRALEDCNWTIKTKPDLAPAFCNRGTAYLGKGDRELALRDYDQAISLKADFAIAICNRGFALFSKGEIDRASVDFDRAVELEPNLALAFRIRGVVSFCNRRFAQARKDCAEATRLDANDCNNLIWLYLANVRDGLTKKAQVQAEGMDLDEWPGPGFAFLLGSLTREGLLAASHNENLYKQREQLCAAHFFIGQAELFNGHLVEAAESFRNAIASGAMNCLEYVAAERELQDVK